MSDLRKKSGILYLSGFLLIVCAAAATIMTVTAVLTENPIREQQELTIKEALKQVLPAFENADSETVLTEDGLPATFYTARDLQGKIVGYAVRTRTMQGYGGEIEALTGFQKSGKILKIVITAHNETPGLGSKVMERKTMRRVKDIFAHQDKSQDELPPNEALDSYIGKSVWEKNEVQDENVSFVTGASKKSKTSQLSPHAIRRNEVHFVSGATVSSLALLDLVNRAGAVLRTKTTTGESQP